MNNFMVLFYGRSMLVNAIYLIQKKLAQYIEFNT